MIGPLLPEGPCPHGSRRTVKARYRLLAKRILGIGVPSAFENCLFEAGRIVRGVRMIIHFRHVQIAANAVANNIDGVGCIPGKAIGLAMIKRRGPLRRRRGLTSRPSIIQRRCWGWAYSSWVC